MLFDVDPWIRVGKNLGVDNSRTDTHARTQTYILTSACLINLMGVILGF